MEQSADFEGQSAISEQGATSEQSATLGGEECNFGQICDFFLEQSVTHLEEFDLFGTECNFKTEFDLVWSRVRLIWRSLTYLELQNRVCLGLEQSENLELTRRGVLECSFNSNVNKKVAKNPHAKLAWRGQLGLTQLS